MQVQGHEQDLGNGKKNDQNVKQSRPDRILIILVTVVIILFVAVLVLCLLIWQKTGLKYEKTEFEKFLLLQSNTVLDKEISPISMNDVLKSKFIEKYGSMMDIVKSTIFVGIPSYRDPELIITLKDLYNKAVYKDRVYIGVVEQNNTKEDNWKCFSKYFYEKEDPTWGDQHIRCRSLDYTETKGPTWARHLIEELYRGEDYVLMLDSHIRFEPGWDCELLEMIKKTRRPQRTVISVYPEGFEREEDKDTKEVSYKIPHRRYWRIQSLKDFNNDGMLEFESSSDPAIRPGVPMYTNLVGACFYFAHSDMYKLVPFQPNTPFLFFGEELFLSARLWTHGFDIVSPTHSVVYHYWKREYRKTYWENDKDALRRESIQHITDIMNRKKVDPKYGLGEVRSIDQFWDYLGVDFHLKKFTRGKSPWKLPPNYVEFKDTFLLNPQLSHIPLKKTN